jgi:hypothetical protein
MLKSWDIQPTEPPKAFASFAAYRDLPSKERSLKRVAELTGVKLSTLKTRSAKFGWIERATSHDRHLDRIGQQKFAESSEKSRARMRFRLVDKLARAADDELTKLIIAIKNSDAREVDKIRDLTRMIGEAVRLSRLLSGESTSIIETTFDPTRLSDKELAEARELAKKASPEG